MTIFAMKLLRMQDWPLRRKILAILLVASTLPLLAASYVAVGTSRRLEMAIKFKDVEAQTDHVVIELEKLHARYLDAAKLLGNRARTARDYAQASAEDRRNNKKLESDLEKPLKFINDGFDEEDTGRLHALAYLTPAGHVIRSQGKDLNVKNIDPGRLANRFFKEAVDTGNPQTSHLYSAQELGDKPTVAYAYPMVEKGKVELVAVLWADAAVLWEVLQKNQPKAAPDGYVALLDQHGVCIADTRGDERLFHPAGKLDPETLADMLNENRFGPMTDRLRDPIPFINKETTTTLSAGKTLTSRPWASPAFSPRARRSIAWSRNELSPKRPKRSFGPWRRWVLPWFCLHSWGECSSPVPCSILSWASDMPWPRSGVATSTRGPRSWEPTSWADLRPGSTAWPSSSRPP